MNKDDNIKSITMPLDLPYTNSDIENQISKKEQTKDELVEKFLNEYGSPAILYRILNILYGIKDMNKRNDFIEELNIFEKDELKILRNILDSDGKILNKIEHKQKEASKQNILTIQKIMNG